MLFAFLLAFEGRPQNKQTIEGTAEAVTGEVTFEVKGHQLAYRQLKLNCKLVTRIYCEIELCTSA